MSRTLLITSLVALMATGCTSPAKASAESGDTSKRYSETTDTKKMSAPVEVSSEVGEGQARVTVRFTSHAEGVSVNIRGVDGLEVANGGNVVEGESFEQGAERTFDVTFTAPESRSHLVVSVNGNFRGAHLGKVASFAIGDLSKDALRAAPKAGETIEGGEQPVKVMPSGK